MPASLASAKYRFPAKLIKGALLKRYKRFLADVLLPDGQTIVAHCPNSGAMTGCAHPGMEIALSYNPAPKRRTAYTWQLSTAENSLICVNTGLANHLIYAAATSKTGRFFQDAAMVKPEVKVSGHSRLDLLVEDASGQKLYAEIKSVTLRQGNIAMFPDAITSRGARHLQELEALKACGHRALILFLVNREDVEGFAPARHIDPAYAKALQRALSRGVEMLVWQCKVSLEGLELWRELPWQLD